MIDALNLHLITEYCIYNKASVMGLFNSDVPQIKYDWHTDYNKSKFANFSISVTSDQVIFQSWLYDSDNLNENGDNKLLHDWYTNKIQDIHEFMFLVSIVLEEVKNG